MSNSSAPDNSGWSESNNNVTSPFQLELENNSFRYVYEFNSSYIGLGKNNLSLVVSDVVLASAWYNDTILSRMLSYNGSFAEDGSSATPTTSRPSISFSPDSLLHFEIGFGLIACILILAFVNFWLLE
jgi:hypothetical protein